MRNHIIGLMIVCCAVGCGKKVVEVPEVVSPTKTLNAIAAQSEVPLLARDYFDRIDAKPQRRHLLVEANFEPIEVDLASWHRTDEQLAMLIKEDSEATSGQSQNSVHEFVTSEGTFRVISCFGRQSINAESYNSGGFRYDMIQLPDNQWIPGFPVSGYSINKTVEIDGSVYLITDHHIIRWLDSSQVVVEVSLKTLNADGYAEPNIRENYDTADGSWFGYWEVHSSNASNFGGLLQRCAGQWYFHQYTGKFDRWIDTVEQNEHGVLTLTLDTWNDTTPKEQIVFDPETLKFTDL